MEGHGTTNYKSWVLQTNDEIRDISELTCSKFTCAEPESENVMAVLG